MYLEQVQSYNYLGSTVNSDNSIEEEIQYRIKLGNKAYYAIQFLCKIDWSPKNQNWNCIEVLWDQYACEVWVLKETIKNKLMVSERKVLRKIFGPTK